LPDREKYIIDDDDDESNDAAQSDLVKLVLSLAYMTEEKAHEFNFSKLAYRNVISGLIGQRFKNFSNYKRIDVV